MTTFTTYPTFAELNEKVRNDLDLQEETFISETEMIGICNEAITEAEQEVHTLYEDYFLSHNFLAITSGIDKYSIIGNSLTLNGNNNTIYLNDGTDKSVAVTGGTYTPETLAATIETRLNSVSTDWICTYDATVRKFTIGRTAGTAILRFSNSAEAIWETLGYTITTDTDVGTGREADEEHAPCPDIYGHKIRRIIFRQGSRVYKVGRIQDWRKFEAYSIDRVSNNHNLYMFFLSHKTPTDPKILVTPIPRDTGRVMEVWYIRRANQIVNTNDFMDIPEAKKFVIQFMKVECLKKEKTNPTLQLELLKLEKERQLLNGVLATMVPDADNEIEADYSSYEEMS